MNSASAGTDSAIVGMPALLPCAKDWRGYWYNILNNVDAVHEGIDEDTLSRIRKELKASLPPFTAEMSPGLVPNVVTGRIANRLDLMGPNYIVDAAGSSSLVAVELAI